MYKKIFKRSVDILISLLGLIILCPVFLVVLVVLYFSNRGSDVFFKQARPGKDEKEFKILKFKTMNDKKLDGVLLPDSQRLTRMGKLLRSMSLDELPQLINVFKGDMSIVGPRPLVSQYLALYSKEQAHRHDVHPGITGWAQVNGRNAISWTKKFEYDVYYVRNVSFLLDIKVIIKTIGIIFKRDGIYKENDVNSMEAFNGKN